MPLIFVFMLCLGLLTHSLFISCINMHHASAFNLLVSICRSACDDIKRCLLDIYEYFTSTFGFLQSSSGVVHIVKNYR